MNFDTYKTPFGYISLFKNEEYIKKSFDEKSYWDIETLIELKKYIDPTKNILEIGGHCGTSSLVYSSFLNNKSKLYVFEPQYNLFSLLTKNINQNSLNYKIFPFNLGIFCYNGLGKMNALDLDGTNPGLVKKRYTDEINLPCNFGGICLGKDGENISLTTIDSMDFKNIGYIHCDAQGSEPYIFSSAVNLISKNRPVIYFENNKDANNYLYKNVVLSYPEYESNSKFDIIDFCINKLKYSKYIKDFNGSITNDLLIP
jgi:FkbM family methyltransferase